MSTSLAFAARGVAFSSVRFERDTGRRRKTRQMPKAQGRRGTRSTAGRLRPLKASVTAALSIRWRQSVATHLEQKAGEVHAAGEAEQLLAAGSLLRVAAGKETAGTRGTGPILVLLAIYARQLAPDTRACMLSPSPGSGGGQTGRLRRSWGYKMWAFASLGENQHAPRVRPGAARRSA